jgi:hypothetical protein
LPVGNPFASAETHPTREAMLPNKGEEGETTSMKPRIPIMTLGVDDLDKSLTFYRDGLGLPTQGIIGKEFEYGAVVFFELQNGVKSAEESKPLTNHTFCRQTLML